MFHSISKQTCSKVLKVPSNNFTKIQQGNTTFEKKVDFHKEKMEKNLYTLLLPQVQHEQCSTKYFLTEITFFSPAIQLYESQEKQKF